MIMDLKAYLDQGEVWITAGLRSGEPGPTLKIESMDVEHRRKAARWLISRSTALISIVECQINEGILSDEGDADLRSVLSLVAQDPRFWLRNTALFKALTKDVPTKTILDI